MINWYGCNLKLFNDRRLIHSRLNKALRVRLDYIFLNSCNHNKKKCTESTILLKLHTFTIEKAIQKRGRGLKFPK